MSIFINRFKKNLFLYVLLCTFSSICITSFSNCSSPKVFAFACQERQIEIYVNDEYLGRDLVYDKVPKGCKYLEVSCRDNGYEIYHRRISADRKNGNLIDLQIPKNYKYSNKPY